jgi:hypothetical protein
LEILEDERQKARRRRSSPEPEMPRVKSEAELREEAAWTRVEQTGKPLVLDGCLLLPKGMSIWQALDFLPDGTRERTEATLDAQMSHAWQVIFNRTEKDVVTNGASSLEEKRMRVSVRSMERSIA